MIKLWNPIKAYRRASQRAKNEQAQNEAKRKICIGDYTDSNGSTFTALLIDGIPVHRITADNIVESEMMMQRARKEYFNKKTIEEQEGGEL
jgi:hypothetical protein